jgi:hypothetical protein
MTHEQAVAKQAAERYLLDEMPELERFAFEEHYFACAICAEDVKSGAVMQEGVKAGLLLQPEVGSRESGVTTEAEGTTDKAEGTRQKAEHPQDLKTSGPQDLSAPSPKPQAPSLWRVALPWAAAATFALATSYQALWVVPGLRQQIVGPEVLSPITLRGAARGTEPTLTRPGAGVIAFAVDLAGVAAGASLTYDLRAADGVSVASGTAAAPPPGTPLLLLIPASALDSVGRYTLSIGTTGAPGSLEYRFTLTGSGK